MPITIVHCRFAFTLNSNLWSVCVSLSFILNSNDRFDFSNFFQQMEKYLDFNFQCHKTTSKGFIVHLGKKVVSCQQPATSIGTI